jgi:hypothetical protein
MEDIHAMAPAVLRHRILMNFKAEAEGITSDKVTEELIKVIERKGSLNQPHPTLPGREGFISPLKKSLPFRGRFRGG